MGSHVVIVAFEVNGDDREAAQRSLMSEVLPLYPPTGDAPSVVSWWIAEDDRVDGSDNDSAVFVPVGLQADIRDHLRDREDHFGDGAW